MSNPGVIQLASIALSDRRQFRVEDNIGEAIHLHYGDEFRVDETYQNFMELSGFAGSILNEMLGQTGFDIKYFDKSFIADIADKLTNIEKVEFDTVELGKLKIQTLNMFKLPVIRYLKYPRVYKALKGNKEELIAYKQENHRGQSNVDRVDSMYKLLQQENYPFDNKYIILFNDSNIIKDGQHRAACLLELKGDISIPVIRIQFKNKQYGASEHPWIAYLFIWKKERIKKFLKKIIYKIRQKIKVVLIKIKYKTGLWK